MMRAAFYAISSFLSSVDTSIYAEAMRAFADMIARAQPQRHHSSAYAATRYSRRHDGTISFHDDAPDATIRRVRPS